MQLKILFEKIAKMGIDNELINYSIATTSLYNINFQNIEDYPVMCLMPYGTHRTTKNIISYSIALYYIDRLNRDGSNEFDILSTSIEVLKSLVNNVRNIKGVVDVSTDYNITNFTDTQRLSDKCAGAFVTLNVDVLNENSCSLADNEVEENTIKLKNQIKYLSIDKNGRYNVTYDEGYNGLKEVEIDVELDTSFYIEEGYNEGRNAGIEEGKQLQKELLEPITITENGTYNREDGYSEIVVEVPDLNGSYDDGYNDGYNVGDADGYNRGYNEGETTQKDKLIGITITENGTYSKEDGYNEIKVEVPDLNGDYDTGYNDGYNVGDVEGYDRGKTDGYNEGYNEGVIAQKSKLSSITILKNGTYTNEDGYNEITVDVGNNNKNYSFKTNYVDEDGLRAIGWDEDDINWFKANTSHYDWENENYVVSDANKALYGVITADNIEEYKNNPDLVFLPKITGSINNNFLRDCKYLKGMPYLEVAGEDGSIFFDNTQLETIPPLNFSNITTANYIFRSCDNLKSLPLLDFSSLQGCTGMFNNCKSLVTIPCFDFSKAESVFCMFDNCISLITIPSINLSNVKNAIQLFQKCSNLRTIPNLDLSNVEKGSWMFYLCGSLVKVPYLNLAKNTDFTAFFYECEKLEEVEGIDTSSAIKVKQMYYGCKSLTKIPEMNFGNVNEINQFFGYSTLNNITECGGFINLKTNWNDNNGLAKCPNLTYQSCINILNGLADVTELGGRTLKVHSNFLTAVGDEISIGINKGWSITA